MTTLQKLSDELNELETQILELVGEGDPDPNQLAELESLLESNATERDKKLEAYASVISLLETRAAWRKAEAKRLSDRAQIDESQAQWLKENLKGYFSRHQIKIVETNRYRITLAANGGKAPLIIDVDPIDLPEEYTITELIHKPDREGIRTALESGQTLPFARLGERGSTIRIK
ncbi:MAG: siphovirus Gp157 family protein [Cyanobacteriota bacterium]|nr:siphovirus Gp157 family protein [Cyanobacteriota bacterium]